MSLNIRRDDFLKAIKEEYGNVTSINRPQVLHISEKLGVKVPAWLVNDPDRRVSRGVYRLTVESGKKTPKKSTVKAKHVIPNTLIKTGGETDAKANTISEMSKPLDNIFIPTKMAGYVPFGFYDDLTEIIKSNIFFPTYISGLSGNGKTQMVKQICATLGREMVRANITRETDEDDLIGGFRLVNGDTVWQNGPVVTAMERGAILLLDEVDLGDHKLMCLQPVLEGESIFIKKINKLVSPAPGFNVVATANTKGRGSDDGKFIGANVQNEAFLERFAITVEQEYPPMKSEEKIIKNILKLNGKEDTYPNLATTLVKWADSTRKTFYDGAATDLISTRRLVMITEALLVFGDEMKAITMCLNRFDKETKDAFLDLYRAVRKPDGEPAADPANRPWSNAAKAVSL